MPLIGAIIFSRKKFLAPFDRASNPPFRALPAALAHFLPLFAIASPALTVLSQPVLAADDKPLYCSPAHAGNPFNPL